MLPLKNCTKEKGRRSEILRYLIPTSGNLGLHSRTKGERVIIDIMKINKIPNSMSSVITLSLII